MIGGFPIKIRTQIIIYYYHHFRKPLTFCSSEGCSVPICMLICEKSSFLKNVYFYHMNYRSYFSVGTPSPCQKYISNTAEHVQTSKPRADAVILMKFGYRYKLTMRNSKMEFANNFTDWKTA